MNRQQAFARLALALSLWSRLVHAEAPSPPTEALELGHAALRHYEARAWAPALSGFEAAERAMHSPVFVLYTARCLTALGRWGEARLSYDAIITQPAQAEEPAPWQAARQEARAELAALDAAQPTLRVDLEGGAAGLRLSVDGEPIARERLAQPMPLNPGPHELLIERGNRVERRTLELAASTHVAVVVSSEQPRQAAATAAKDRPVMRADPPPPPRAPSTRAAAIVSLGIGAAGLLTGAVTGFLAFRARQELSERCAGHICDSSLESHAARGQSLANVATVSLVVGATGLATGGVLFYFSPATPDPRGGSAGHQVGAVGTF